MIPQGLTLCPACGELKGTLLYENQWGEEFTTVETIATLLRRPTEREISRPRRAARNIIITIATGCQLITAAAHSDNYPPYPKCTRCIDLARPDPQSPRDRTDTGDARGLIGGHMRRLACANSLADPRSNRWDIRVTMAVTGRSSHRRLGHNRIDLSADGLPGSFRTNRIHCNTS